MKRNLFFLSVGVIALVLASAFLAGIGSAFYSFVDTPQPLGNEIALRILFGLLTILIVGMLILIGKVTLLVFSIVMKKEWST